MPRNWSRPDPLNLAYELSSHSPNKGSKEYPLGGFRDNTIAKAQEYRSERGSEDPALHLLRLEISHGPNAFFRITILNK